MRMAVFQDGTSSRNAQEGWRCIQKDIPSVRDLCHYEISIMLTFSVYWYSGLEGFAKNYPLWENVLESVRHQMDMKDLRARKVPGLCTNYTVHEDQLVYIDDLADREEEVLRKKEKTRKAARRAAEKKREQERLSTTVPKQDVLLVQLSAEIEAQNWPGGLADYCKRYGTPFRVSRRRISTHNQPGDGKPARGFVDGDVEVVPWGGIRSVSGFPSSKANPEAFDASSNRSSHRRVRRSRPASHTPETKMKMFSAAFLKWLVMHYWRELIILVLIWLLYRYVTNVRFLVHIFTNMCS